MLGRRVSSPLGIERKSSVQRVMRNETTDAIVPAFLTYQSGKFCSFLFLCTKTHTTPDVISCLPRNLASAFAVLWQNGDTVVNWREISKRYMRNWFIVDFLSTVPVDKLVRGVERC